MKEIYTSNHMWELFENFLVDISLVSNVFLKITVFSICGSWGEVKWHHASKSAGLPNNLVVTFTWLSTTFTMSIFHKHYRYVVIIILILCSLDILLIYTQWSPSRYVNIGCYILWSGPLWGRSLSAADENTSTRLQTWLVVVISW